MIGKGTAVAPLIVVVALLGLAIGSFLNVVIHRIPARASLSRPASHCPVCGHSIRKRHNVPLLGWLVLRGRCADCRSSISVRYPLIELMTAALFVAVSLRIGDLQLLAVLPAVLYFTAAGICLAFIDLDVGRLPNAIVYPSYPVLALLLALGAIGQRDAGALLRSGVGAALLFGVYFALAFAFPSGMGAGDVKLAGLVGGFLAFFSYPVLVVGAFAAFFVGSVVGIGKIAVGRASGKSSLPFGPFMIAGALIALFAGSTVTDFYTRLVVGA